MSTVDIYPYVKLLIGSKALEALEKASMPKEMTGKLRPQLVCSYKVLSKILPRCESGTKYHSAVEYCKSRGLADELARAAVALFFTVNSGVYPTYIGELSPEREGALSLAYLIGESVAFVDGYMAVLENEKPNKNKEERANEAYGIYLILAVSEPEDPEDANIQKIVDAMRGGSDSESSKSSESSESDEKKSGFCLASMCKILPGRYAFSNSKAARLLPLVSRTEGKEAVIDTTGNRTKKKGVTNGKQGSPTQVITKISLNFPEKGPYKELDPYDSLVLNAVSTLWESGNVDITPADIYTILNGGAAPTYGDQLVAPLNSLEKLLCTTIEIDAKQEIEKRGLKLNDDDPFVQGSVTTQLLRGSIVKLRSKSGIDISYLHLDSEPIIYKHASLINENLHMPLQYLNSSGSVSNTYKVTLFREYLARQILYLQGKKRDNPLIRFDTLLKETGINEPKTKTERSRFRKTIRDLLDNFVKKGLLTSYEEVTEARKIIGVKLAIAKRG